MSAGCASSSSSRTLCLGSDRFIWVLVLSVIIAGTGADPSPPASVRWRTARAGPLPYRGLAGHPHPDDRRPYGGTAGLREPSGASRRGVMENGGCASFRNRYHTRRSTPSGTPGGTRNVRHTITPLTAPARQ